MTLSSTTLLPTTGTPTSPVLPPQTSISLASSLMVTMTVAPGVDTTGIDIEGAKAAYYGFVGVADRAVLEPTRDWTMEIRKYAVDPVASGAIEEIQAMAQRNVRDLGHSAFVASVLSATPIEISLGICTDNRGSDTVDAKTGLSVKAGQGGKHPQDATVIRTDAGKWFVKSIRGYPDKTC